MGQKARVDEVEDKLTQLFDLIDSDHYPEAKDMLDGLMKEFGESLPEIIEARTMLEFNLENND